MAAPKIYLLASALLLSGIAIAPAQNEVLFEDTFTGSDGTVIPTGTEETYQIVGRDGTVMTPALQNDQLELSIGPNPSEANNFSALHTNARFDFLDQPLLFETDVVMGDAVTMVFALHTWLGNTRIEGSANNLTVGFFNSGTRLLLSGKNGGTETVRHEIPDFDKTEFRLGVYLDETEVKLLLDGVVVFSDPHGLSLDAFDPGAYLALQLFGGGDTAHSYTFDNLRVVGDPDLTPPDVPTEPEILISDTFDGPDGEISLTSPSPYRTAVRDGVEMAVTRENEELKISMGPNSSGSSNFSMLHHNNRLRFDERPLLFEVDVDKGDMNTVAIGLHTWLGNENLLYGNNVSATVYGGGRLVFQTLNDGTATDARYESEPDEFEDRSFRLGFYVDETDIVLFIDGEVRYDGPHYLADALVDDGAYFGIQVHGGGDGLTQSSTFDNLLVTANPDITIPEVFPGNIYWATDSAIRSSNFEGGEVQTLVGNLGRPIGLAVDFDSEQMYWVEHDTGRLMRADTNGDNVTELRTDLQTAQFLALDADAAQLYWAEWDAGLYTSPVDGSDRDQLVSASFGSNTGVALSDDRVFLVSAATGDVTGYPLDGNGSAETVTSFAGQTYGIAVSPSGEELFASNFSEGWIKAYHLQDDEVRTVWDGLSQPLGLALSPDGEEIFWAERTEDEANGRIRVANADGSGAISTLVEGESSPFGIALRPGQQIPTGFADWIAGFGLNETEAGIHDDPAGDGIANLIKYALGLDPTESAREALPRPEIQELDGEAYLSMTVEQNPDASGLTWVFEVSTDLTNWSSDPLDVLVEENGQTTTAWSTARITEKERHYMRVRIVAD